MSPKGTLILAYFSTFGARSLAESDMRSAAHERAHTPPPGKGPMDGGVTCPLQTIFFLFRHEGAAARPVGGKIDLPVGARQKSGQGFGWLSVTVGIWLGGLYLFIYCIYQFIYVSLEIIGQYSFHLFIYLPIIGARKPCAPENPSVAPIFHLSWKYYLLCI